MQNRNMQLKYPNPNHKEWAALVNAIEPRLIQGRIDRIFIPQCDDHPHEFFKQEIVFEVSTDKNQFQLLISLRQAACALVLLNSKTLKPARHSTHSSLDLVWSKWIIGKRIQEIKTVTDDRIVKFQFATQKSNDEDRLELKLYFIPQQTNSILRQGQTVLHQIRPEAVPKSVSNSIVKDAKPNQKVFELGSMFITQSNLPDEVPDELPFFQHFLKIRNQNAQSLRIQRVMQILDQQHQQAAHKLKSEQEMLKNAQNQPDFAKFGSLLQAQLYTKPIPIHGHYPLIDFSTESIINVPIDDQLTPSENLKRFFHLAKRNTTRIAEAKNRIEALEQKINQLLSLKNQVQPIDPLEKQIKDLPALESIETKLGIKKDIAFTGTPPSRLQNKKLASFTGKQFQSREGMMILVGRNSAENLELTLRIARGNDWWFHVKGRPGAHVVVSVPAGKTASLDTLLDAAQLCVHYSHGRDWGKTEVDYTKRKNVKRIKKSTEVSYTGNKTLTIIPDPKRIEALFLAADTGL
jgi:predicted ribosome quality control (RQC) complex YloA/Tae2 family protein